MKDMQKQIDRALAGHVRKERPTTPEASVATAFKAEGYRAPPGPGRNPIPYDGKISKEKAR